MKILPSELWKMAWEQSSESNPRTTDDVAEERFWQENAKGYDDKHPLAPHVGSLTVVEPSAAMAGVFRSNWAGTEHTSLEVLLSKWEDTPEICADVLFSANAFYRIRDMRESLLKMNRTAKRHVFLVQSAGKPNAKPLQVLLNDEAYEWERATLISGILFELNIRLVNVKSQHHYYIESSLNCDFFYLCNKVLVISRCQEPYYISDK